MPIWTPDLHRVIVMALNNLCMYYFDFLTSKNRVLKVDIFVSENILVQAIFLIFSKVYAKVNSSPENCHGTRISVNPFMFLQIAV
jgi:hypothetical protein